MLCLSRCMARAVWNDAGFFQNLKTICEQGQIEKTLQTVDLLDLQGFKFPKVILYDLLNNCIKNRILAAGRKVHHLIVKCGYESNSFLGSHLIRMFAACGSLSEADLVFYKLQQPNVFTWSAIISAHATLGQCEQAVNLYHQLLNSSIKPDARVFLAVLKACGGSAVLLTQARMIHANVLEAGFETDIFVCNTLIDIYAKYGCLEDAVRVFENVPNQSIVTWNAMITGYALNGPSQEALRLFHQMQQEGKKPDKFTFVSALKACSSIAAREQGKVIHAQILESGIDWDGFMGSTLIDMYAKNGSLPDAQRVFDELRTHDAVTCNAMIAGYAQHGHIFQALQLFLQMQEEGGKPDSVTFLSIIKELSSLELKDQAKLIHAHVIESGFESDIFVASAIIDMYAKCGSTNDARRVFDKLHKRDLVTWNSMIAGYIQHGLCEAALQLYRQMQQEGVRPNSVTSISIVKACSKKAAPGEGELIHRNIDELDFCSDLCVINTLIDVYFKSGHVNEARLLFDKLTRRDVITWNTMIVGCAQHGYGQEALGLFQKMQQDNMEPNNVTFASTLKACSTLAALDQGQLIHAHITRSGLESDIYVDNALIDMYTKSGSLEDACKVFNSMPRRDEGTWNAIITGHAQMSNYKVALQCFEDMQKENLKPDDVTFVSLLCACSHEGLVDRGFHYFKLMTEVYGIRPTAEHFHCMVDLLGRAGYLKEAEDLLQAMPSEPSIAGWMSMLSNCRTYGKVEVGKRCFDHAIMLDPTHGSAYTLMSNIYIDADMREDADNIQELRAFVQAWKKPGRALVAVECNFNDFMVEDTSHPQSYEMYAKLKRLDVEMS